MTGARLLYCQPTFHNPTGTVLSPERRQQVVDVARTAGAFLIEGGTATCAPWPPRCTTAAPSWPALWPERSPTGRSPRFRKAACTCGSGEMPTLLPFQPPMLASIATGIRHGFLDGTSRDLAHILGRPVSDPLPTAVAAASATKPEAAA